MIKMKMDLQLFGGRGAGSGMSKSKGGGSKLNPRYASFLKNGNAKEENPQNIKTGDSIITNPIDKEGNKLHTKWKFEIGGSDSIYSGDVTVTNVKKTSKQTKITGITATGKNVTKTYKNIEPIWVRKGKVNIE